MEPNPVFSQPPMSPLPPTQAGETASPEAAAKHGPWLAIPAAGLAVALLVCWWFSPGPGLRRDPFLDFWRYWFVGIAYWLAALLLAATVAVQANQLSGGQALSRGRMVRLTATAGWLATALLFFQIGGWLVLPVALFASVSVWRGYLAWPVKADFAAEGTDPLIARRLGFAFLSSLGLQLSVLAGISSHKGWAAVGLALSWLGWRAAQHTLQPTGRANAGAGWRMVVSHVASLFLILLILARFVVSPSGGSDGIWGLLQGRAVMMAQMGLGFVLPDPYAKGVGAGREEQEGSGDDSQGVSAIILVPPFEETKQLVAPTRKSLIRSNAVGPALPDRIPFTGVYWLYKPPKSQPEGNARRVRGTPLERKFFSTTRNPLRMQARQSFGSFYSLVKVGELRIGIESKDKMPAMLYLDVQLLNSKTGRKAFLPRWQPTQAPDPNGEVVQEEMVLPLPTPGEAMQEFDEIAIHYQLFGMRQDASARIGIAYFKFIRR